MQILILRKLDSMNSMKEFLFTGHFVNLGKGDSRLRVECVACESTCYHLRRYSWIVQ